MIRLSERLEKIAALIEKGERVADIGTDHGYIPIYLKQMKISDYIVAGDINEGPLEKMDENLRKYLGDDRDGIYMRLGGGLGPLNIGEVDTVVIAGMGGLLMIDILEEDISKSRSYKKYIFQPRNAQDKLRKWLLENGFSITNEILARESRFVWEIIAAEPVEHHVFSEYMDSGSEYFRSNIQQYEVGQLLIERNDPLLKDFILRKLVIQREIVENASRSFTREALANRDKALDMIDMLEGILKNVSE